MVRSRIVGAEVAVAAVEAAELAIRPSGFEDGAADAGASRNSCARRRYSSLLMWPNSRAVLRVMFVELSAAAKSRSRGEEQSGGEEEADCDPGWPCSHVFITPHWRRGGVSIQRYH